MVPDYLSMENSEPCLLWSGLTLPPFRLVNAFYAQCVKDCELVSEECRVSECLLEHMYCWGPLSIRRRNTGPDCAAQLSASNSRKLSHG